MRSIFSYLTRLWIRPQTPTISQKVSLGLFACSIENTRCILYMKPSFREAWQEPTLERCLGCCSAFCSLLFVDGYFFVPSLGEKLAGIVQGPCTAGSRWSLCYSSGAAGELDPLPSATDCSSSYGLNYFRILWDAPGEWKMSELSSRKVSKHQHQIFTSVNFFPTHIINKFREKWRKA